MRRDARCLAWQMTLEGLAPATLVLGLLYLGLSLINQSLPVEQARILTPVSVLTSVILLAFYVLIRRSDFRSVTPRVLACLVAGFMLGNSLLRLVVLRQPPQTINLILLLVGAGYLFLSSGLYALLIGLTLVGWLVTVLVIEGTIALLPPSPWHYFGCSLVASAGIGIIIQITRIRGYRHFEYLRQETELRAQNERQRSAYLETLISVGRGVTSFLNLDALLDHVVQTMSAAFGYEYVSILLADGGGTRLIVRAGTGEVGQSLVQQAYTLEIGGAGLVRWVATHLEPAWTNDVEHEARYVKADFFPDTRSEMVLPLVSKNKLLGVLDIQATQVGAFTEEDLRVCLSLADQISSAIVNASRYEAEQSRRALAETLYTVGRALSRTLDVSEVLGLVLDGLKRIVSFDRGAVMLERNGELEFAAAQGFPPDTDPQEMRVSIREGDVYEQINRTKTPLIIAEIGDRPDWEYVENLPRACSWVGLPLTDAEDNVIGMLSLVRETPDPYTDDEVALGAALAGQAGVALHNARLYMELSEAYSQLARLDRAKSDFIALASHELRTPMTLVTGYAYMLAAEPVVCEDTELSPLAEGLVQGIGRLQEIVERMMDLAEIENKLLYLSFVPISLADMLHEVVSEFEPALGQRALHLIVEENAACPEIDADQAALTKVLRHLILNAIKYTPDGGEIRISSTVYDAEREDPDEARVEIVVTDTGIGIDMCDQERIFDKFYQTGEISLHSSGTVKFMGGGPGLGLAIVKGIVAAHGGTVWVRSLGFDPDNCPGSSFHVLLPMRQDIRNIPPPELPVFVGGNWS